jgi:glucokinase
MHQTGRLILAGDVGGTKTDLAVFPDAEGRPAPVAEATFASRDHASLQDAVRAFLARCGLRVDSALFGVAGPVAGGKARITNLPWVLDEAELSAALGLERVRLVNDLQAVAAGVPLLEDAELCTLNRGVVDRHGAVAVIAPGTGLGEAFLIWDGSRHRAFPSQGGHADFAPADARQAELLAYLRARHGHVSCERVCSGMGLPNIIAFLRERGGGGGAEQAGGDPPGAGGDPTPAIIAAALDLARPDARCRAALDIFAAVLGAEAGNLALKVMASGGVYLGGGIPPRILPVLQAGGFLAAFRGKGRMADLMAGIPVHVILNPKTALLGAAVLARDGGRAARRPEKG